MDRVDAVTLSWSWFLILYSADVDNNYPVLYDSLQRLKIIFMSLSHMSKKLKNKQINAPEKGSVSM